MTKSYSLLHLPCMRLVEFHLCQAAYAISNIRTVCYLARKNAELYLAHLPLISTLIDIIYILLLLSHSTVFCYFWDQDFPLSLKYVIRWFTSILKESGKNISWFQSQNLPSAIKVINDHVVSRGARYGYFPFHAQLERDHVQVFHHE